MSMDLMHARHADLWISTQDGCSGMLVTCRGEVDLSTCAALGHAIAAQGPDGPDVTVDLAGVTFMDSSGVRVLLRSQWSIAPRTVTIVNPSRQVRRLLQTVRLTARFGVCPERHDRTTSRVHFSVPRRA